MKALFFGDSISDNSYTTTATTASGFYADMLCGQQGWARVGQVAGNANRAAISGTCLEASPLIPVLFNNDAGVASFDRRVRAYAPDILIVNYGTNDFAYMAHGLDLNTWAATWETFWGFIQTLDLKRPAIVLGLMASMYVPPLPAWAYNAEWLRAHMDAITRDAALARGCTFVPLAGMSASHMRGDGHPNPRGHGLIAGEILTALGTP